MSRDRKCAGGLARVSRRVWLSWSVGSIAALAARRSPADDPTDAALARIARARASVRTLRGPFTQTRSLGLLATAVRSRGMLTLVRPDRLRWELEPPDAITFWIGPEGLAYRSAHDQGRVDRAAAQTAAIASALEDMRTVLGGDLTRLRERWDLSILRDDATGVEIRAEARDDAGAAPRQLTFALGADRVRPTHVLLVEGPHDKTTIDFGDLTVDGPVDEAAMRLPSR